MLQLKHIAWDTNYSIHRELTNRLRKIHKKTKKAEFGELVRIDPAMASMTLEVVKAEYKRWIHGRDNQKPAWLPI